MSYSNTDILYASLLGSKVAEQIPRFTEVENVLMKHVLPPIKFLPLNNQEFVEASAKDTLKVELWKADNPTAEGGQFFPLSFMGDDGKWFLLPYEPMINIQGKNTIVRRNVAKAKGMVGSIKERWNRADYEITITGVLIGSIMTGDVGECFPKKDFERLRHFMESAKTIGVLCPPFELLGINKIVIEDFSFPFTKGENVQAYEIKAYSDHPYDLLMPVKY